MRRTACLACVISAVLLAACGSQTTSPKPAVPDTPAPSPEVRASPALSPTPRPTLLDTRPPAPTPTLPAVPTWTPPPAAGPFVLVPPAAGWLEGNVRDLRVAPGGVAWLVTERGVGRWQDGAWMLLREEAGWLAGFDDSGRAWWIPAEEEAIRSWDGTAWTSYGVETGWVPLQDPGRTSVAADRRGWVWLVDREAVYTFDGQRWMVQPFDQVGFAVDPLDAEYEGFRLTKVVRDGEGDIWVSDCNTYGESTGGQGARWFDGTRWGGADSPVTGAGCVNDMELDAQGRLWLGIAHDVARYTPGEGWEQFGSPEFDPAWGNFMGDILALAVGPRGDAWAYFDICGGASCGNLQKLFHLQGAQWVWAGDCNWECNYDTNITFAPDGSAWFYANYSDSGDPAAPRSGVYHVVGGTPQLVAPWWHCQVLAIDGAGRVWLVPSSESSEVYVHEKP